MLNTILNCQFTKFAIVGAGGLFVDGLVLVLLIGMNWTLFQARIGSFAIAVSVTWFLNRKWTFNRSGLDKPAIVQQYTYYLMVQAIGAGINIGIFFLVIYWSPMAQAEPLVALAAGSLIAMGFNYVLAKKIVYTK
jgi:putative flippase GtrA